MSRAAGAPHRLVLWDIDGTLLNGGGVGGDVFDRAVERATGRRPLSRPAMSGMTDPQIVLEYLSLLELAEPEPHVDPILAHLVEELAAAESDLREQGTVLPGVEAVLGELAKRPEVLQTVLTGNVAANALVKLRAFGLDGRLDLEVGAYGSDHADRRALVPIALGRVAAQRRRSFEPHQVWVIGDSANDLACARAAGALCLLVATGRAGLDELAALGPDAVLADLRQTEDVVDLLTSGDGR